MNKPRILIMAGGTGGHVFPALAVARRLQGKGWEVHWLGTREGLESKIVPNASIPIHYISVKGLRRMGKVGWFFAPVRLIITLFQSMRVMAFLKPNVVLGMGGFVAGPGGVAAWVCRCPLVIHEQNSIVGLTNRWLAPLAKEVLEAFPGAFQPSAKAIYIGNPVREALLDLPLPKERFKERKGALRLLVLGGSRGALALNEICPSAIGTLVLEKRPEIWHQSGGDNATRTADAYHKVGVVARVEPFIEDMAAAYSWADLVLCRAGALTVAELAAVGVGSILVPFPFAVDDHQTRNGRFLEQGNAGVVIAQSTLTPTTLANVLVTLLQDRDRLLKMAEAAYAMAKRDALTRVAAYCEEANKI